MVGDVGGGCGWYWVLAAAHSSEPDHTKHVANTLLYWESPGTHSVLVHCKVHGIVRAWDAQECQDLPGVVRTEPRLMIPV